MKNKINDQIEGYLGISNTIAREVLSRFKSAHLMNDAEDYAMIALAALIDEMEEVRDVKAWLARVIRYQIIDDMRSKHRRLIPMTIEDDLLGTFDHRLRLDNKEHLEGVLQGVQGTPGRMLRFCYANEVSPLSKDGKRLLERSLGLTGNNVNQQLKRARQQIFSKSLDDHMAVYVLIDHDIEHYLNLYDDSPNRCISHFTENRFREFVAECKTMLIYNTTAYFWCKRTKNTGLVFRWHIVQLNLATLNTQFLSHCKTHHPAFYSHKQQRDHIIQTAKACIGNVEHVTKWLLEHANDSTAVREAICPVSCSTISRAMQALQTLR